MKSILLHGLGQTPSSWNNTIKIMNHKVDPICPNLFDWLINKRFCYSNLYEGFEAYCTQFRMPLDLCGLSLGGILAMQYAIEHSERINSLVLIGTQYTMPTRLLQIQNMIFHFLPNSIFHKMGCTKKDFISLCESMMNLDFQHDLGKIACPVLIVCGDRDKANKAASLQLKKRIPQAKLLMIPNAGHEVNIDNPTALGDGLTAFYLTK